MIPLQVFWKHPDADLYRVDGLVSPYAYLATEKRFTDGEMAAEWWKCRYDSADTFTWASDYHLKGERLEVMHRFASLPHFDA